MGDTGDRRTRPQTEGLCPPRDLRREARRLERLRAARGSVTDLASRRRWSDTDPDDDPKAAA